MSESAFQQAPMGLAAYAPRHAPPSPRTASVELVENGYIVTIGNQRYVEHSILTVGDRLNKSLGREGEKA